MPLPPLLLRHPAYEVACEIRVQCERCTGMTQLLRYDLWRHSHR